MVWLVQLAKIRASKNKLIREIDEALIECFLQSETLSNPSILSNSVTCMIGDWNGRFDS